MFSKAIVCQPCQNMINGITSANLGAPNYELALKQHRAYVDALKAIGLDTLMLAAQQEYPDSVFIEDTALVSGDCAIVTRPGDDRRKGEVTAVHSALKNYFDEIKVITAPASIDAGDIMMVGSHFYIGLSDRTNQAGVEQISQLLGKHGKTVSAVSMQEMLHLKTGLSYLEHGNLLINGEFVGKPEFSRFNQIVVPPEEAYAANSLWLNDTVLVPANHRQTQANIAALGYQVIELEMTEFQKLDGGLSCLSLRF